MAHSSCFPQGVDIYGFAGTIMKNIFVVRRSDFNNNIIY
jgi:hypothetical protein